MSESERPLPSRLWREVVSVATGRLTREWGQLTTANLIRLPVALLTSVLVARTLGVAGYGTYQVLVTVATIASVFADPGLGEAAVWRLSRLERRHVDRSELEVRAFFWARVLGGVLVGSAVLLLAVLGAGRWIGLGADAGLVALASVVVLVTSINGAVRSLLQAARRFAALGSVLVVTTVLTLAAAAALVGASLLTPATALGVLPVVGGIAGFALARARLPSGWTLRLPDWTSGSRSTWRLFRFGRWLWIGHVFTLLAGRLDILLVSRSLPVEVTGAYGLALAISGRVGMLYRTLFAVLRPVASAIEGPEEMREYLRRSMIRSGFVGFLLIPGFFLADPIIPWLFGSEFEVAAALFQGLLLVGILEALMIPIKSLYYTLDRPGVLSAVEGVETVVLVGGALATMPVFGVWGVVCAKVAARLAGAVLAVYPLYSNRKLWS